MNLTGEALEIYLRLNMLDRHEMSSAYRIYLASQAMLTNKDWSNVNAAFQKRCGDLGIPWKGRK